jgi:molybdopterin molybdotransferase
LAPRAARLDEAHGSILASPLLSPYDEPFADAAAFDGYAVCAGGPWTLVDLARDVALAPHHAMRVRARQILPGHTDAVLPVARGVLEHADNSTERVTALDALTDLPEPNARPDFGSGVITRGSIRPAGSELVGAPTQVTPAILALAAAAGADDMHVIPPPTVGTLVLGSTLLTQGPPREGRVRDALGWTLPALLGALGARAHPPVRAPDTRDLLLREIDDADVDLLVTTGSTSPGDNVLRSALRDIGAHWLIDGVLVTPGSQTLLVRLPDGRLLLGLPGHPDAAIAGAITLAAPLIAGLRGELTDERLAVPGTVPTRATLTADAPAPDYHEDTVLCPVQVDAGGHGVGDTPVRATPLTTSGPGNLHGWANADAVAVIAPGFGDAGDVVELVDPLGRPASSSGGSPRSTIE